MDHGQLAIFTILKSMEDPHIADIQYNALTSWQHIHPDAAIFVFGDKPGIDDLCRELGVVHFHGIRTNEKGLEFVSDAFDRMYSASQHWKGPVIHCYSNADIILPPNFMEVINTIDAEKFLMVGCRHNVQQKFRFPPDFYKPGWWTALRESALKYGTRYIPNGIDYFVHSPGMFDPLPPLLVGRWYWDNYMIWNAKQKGIPVIDATEVVLALHQEHDFSHAGLISRYEAGAEESEWNRKYLTGGIVPTIDHADYKIFY